MNRVSFSQVQKYSQCPRMFKYHYKDKYREKSVTAFLAIGSAMDAALNDILLDLKKNKTITVDYKKIFDNNWQNISVNKKEYKLIDCTLVGYAKVDFVEELLQDDDRRFIGAKIEELCPQYQGKDLKELKSELEERRSGQSINGFTLSEHKLLNIMNWFSVRRKCHLMLDAYVRDIVPQIEEVKDIQTKIELNSDNGSSLIGYVDAIVKFKGDNEYTVLDNKTAASEYTKDKLTFSSQLSIYTFALGLKKAGYAVMLKSIQLNKNKTCKTCKFESKSKHTTCNNEINGKRCGGEWDEVVSPNAITQLLKGEIPEQTKQVVIENLGEVTDAINANVFPKNLGACANVFGNPCSFIRLCWSGDDSYLEKLNEDN